MSYNWKTYSTAIVVKRYGGKRDELVVMRMWATHFREAVARWEKMVEATSTGKIQYFHGDPIYPIW